MTAAELFALVGWETVYTIGRRMRRPGYVYFQDVIEHKYRQALDVLPEGVRVHYAVKANPFGAVLTLLRGLGAAADVASSGELRAALTAGFAAGDIEFSGPGKTGKELREAIEAGIGSLNVESVSELKHVIDICRTLRLRARVGLRITPAEVSAGATLRMAGDTQFGIAERDLPEAVDALRSGTDVLEFTGIHAHLGSQIVTSDAIVENFRIIFGLALRAMEMVGTPPDRINFGGGWGVPYFPGQGALDLESLREGLRDLFARPEHAIFRAKSRCIVELGRFLVAESGAYLTRVLYLKRGAEKTFAIVDGGLHHNYIAAGGMGQILRRNFEVAALLPPADDTLVPMTIAGCLCTPNDILARDVPMPERLSEGDVVAIFNSGAYGLTASPIHFLSHPAPTQRLV